MNRPAAVLRTLLATIAGCPLAVGIRPWPAGPRPPWAPSPRGVLRP